MDIIDESKFNAARNLEAVPSKHEDMIPISEEEVERLMSSMESPVKFQQEMAIRIKDFLEKRMKRELEQNQSLSDSTRRWVETYNGILEKIQKALHGDLTRNLHIVKVSHSDIAAKIRSIE